MVDLIDPARRKLVRLGAALAIIAPLGACSLYGSPEWTVRELQDWQAEWTAWQTRWPGRPVPWHRLLYYIGSDASHHHFNTRQFDSWVVVRVPKGELMIPEELPLLESVSSRPVGGHYAIDPMDDWRRFRPES